MLFENITVKKNLKSNDINHIEKFLEEKGYTLSSNNYKNILIYLLNNSYGTKLSYLFFKYSSYLLLEEKKLYLKKILKDCCSKDIIDRCIPYILSTSLILDDIDANNIPQILSLLVNYDLDKSLDVIINNKLDGVYFEYFIDNYVTKGPKELFNLLEKLYKFKESFTFDITLYTKKIIESIIKSKNTEIILKTGIYFDNNILNCLFDKKEELIEYMVINKQYTDFIHIVSDKLYSKDEKENVIGIFADKIGENDDVFNKDTINTGIYCDPEILKYLFITKAKMMEFLILNDCSSKSVGNIADRVYENKEIEYINNKIALRVDSLIDFTLSDINKAKHKLEYKLQMN